MEEITASAPRAVRLCRAQDVREGEAKGVQPRPGAQRKIIVLRYRGQFHGWLDACPHYPGGTPMAWRTDAYWDGTGTYLACHSHGALFDPETGACVLGPCLGQALTRVEVRVDPDGDVVATLDG